MTAHTGYLLIADISGYTQFLTSSEQDHANPILQSLLSSLVEQVGEPLHFWKLDGDAVLAYSTQQEFPTGETFLTICENLYNAFADCRQNIIANTTCPCRACANVAMLDLKIMAHHGEFEEMQIGPVKDISGADVILVHRMSKTDVSEATGVRSYALFSDAAVEAMEIKTALVPFSQPFEHFGEVSMQVYDLAKAWEKIRAGRERHFLEEADGVWTYRRHFDLPIALVWDALTAPELKQRWMDSMLSVSVDRPEGRIGTGSAYHCAHEAADFFYRITDWEPFEYFSTRINDPMHDGVSMPETYHLTQTETGTELRYTMGQAHDAEGKRSEPAEEGTAGFLSEFWPLSFDAMDLQLKAAD
ncbi:MAG: DUF2652 domain-containing protein [Rhodospirillaceae bacterium]|jgi:uncharacterized protein YndB with AHSA1/START domain|nr:DUF2652 domain-containing protein [Rhodospirillaceae bacterium]MBT3491888.1 DUF2652 domain-containing protein [Rhodospirillaceae bacterium]MBT3780650.1 DUF2652 domain-containing protein [Rhodospirillaceae bacterium]MBT3978052.1 DUF2652 domain-containing protein [Rhodospirillaceae bacterium]MBT4565843.1 DUF2652 domain-containing protein [Rhodospirillaceae bacterium]